MIDHGKHNLLGVRIDAVDYDAAVERIVAAARQRQPLAVSALAVHGVMTGALSSEHRHRLNELELVVPDGQPVRWGLNWLHRVGLASRVYGPELMLRTCQRAADEGLSVFLFGGNESLLNTLSSSLARKIPGLRIAGVRPSQFRQVTAEEQQEAQAAILASGASITLVGLGCPRQEVWAYENRQALAMPVLAVGAAFAFHAEQLSQAPRYLQDRGLEWFYRLLCEPRRLWRRYLLLNPLYVSMLLAQRVGLRKYEPVLLTDPPQEERWG